MTSARNTVIAPHPAPCPAVRWAFGSVITAMITNSTANGTASTRSTLSTAACPSIGRMAWIATAARTAMILTGPVAPTPSLAASARPAKTISDRPSISKPTWVAQLNRLGTLLPRGPNGARLTVNVVVPACGPCRLASPVSR